MKILDYLLVLVSSVSLQGVSAASLRIHDHTFAPDYTLRVKYENTSIACRSRLSALVNGTSPGPEVVLYENQTTWVRVYNDMISSNLTMHWHGLSQSVAPFSDGTPQASQWPIKPNHFFDYEIRPNIGEAGTYFYHSHVEFQAVSAAGPLIVLEAPGQKSPYVCDAEKTIFISELYNKTDSNIVKGLTATPQSQFSWTGDPEAVLVNGKGFRSLDANQTGAGLPWTPPDYNIIRPCGPEVFDVEPGKTYRFRAIGGVAIALVSFAFEDHDQLEVIAADGRYTKPVSTDRIQIDSGQRFDFLLKTKTDEELARLNKTIFWMQLERRYRPLNSTSYAVLRYNTKKQQNPAPMPTSPPSSAPLNITNDIQDWLEYQLSPLAPNGFPDSHLVTRRVYLDSAQLFDNSGIYMAVNNRTWTEDREHIGPTPFNNTSPNVGTPYLVNVFKHGEAAIPDYEAAVNKYDGWDPKLNVYPAKVGEVIEIVLRNQPNGIAGGFDVHPWHIHGGHIYDIGSGPGEYDPVENEKKLLNYTPAMRDTTMLYKYTTSDEVGTPHPYTNQGWRAWRLRVEDAGVWMVHCHTLQHMVMGMQTVWVMGNSTEITNHSEPYVQGYLDFGGDAYGNETYDPLVHHRWDL